MKAEDVPRIIARYSHYGDRLSGFQKELKQALLSQRLHRVSWCFSHSTLRLWEEHDADSKTTSLVEVRVRPPLGGRSGTVALCVVPPALGRDRVRFEYVHFVAASGEPGQRTVGEALRAVLELPEGSGIEEYPKRGRLSDFAEHILGSDLQAADGAEHGRVVQGADGSGHLEHGEAEAVAGARVVVAKFLVEPSVWGPVEALARALVDAERAGWTCWWLDNEVRLESRPTLDVHENRAFVRVLPSGSVDCLDVQLVWQPRSDGGGRRWLSSLRAVGADVVELALRSALDEAAALEARVSGHRRRES